MNDSKYDNNAIINIDNDGKNENDLEYDNVEDLDNDIDILDEPEQIIPGISQVETTS